MDYNGQKEDINMAKRRRNKKWVYGVVILVLLVVAGIVTYMVWNTYFNKNSDNKGQETAEAEQDEEKKDEAKKSESGSEDSVAEVMEIEREKEKESMVAYEGGNPNNAGGLTGVLTYAGVNGDYLMVRVNIDQYLTSGKCELSITKDGAVVYGETANIVSAASTATCEGFNVPVSAIGTGDFELVIRISSGDKSGLIKGGVSI